MERWGSFGFFLRKEIASSESNSRLKDNIIILLSMNANNILPRNSTKGDFTSIG